MFVLQPLLTALCLSWYSTAIHCDSLTHHVWTSLQTQKGGESQLANLNWLAINEVWLASQRLDTWTCFLLLVFFFFSFPLSSQSLMCVYPARHSELANRLACSHPCSPCFFFPFLLGGCKGVSKQRGG